MSKMEIIIKAEAREIAELVAEIQERQSALRPTNTISSGTIYGGSFEGHVNKPVFIETDRNAQT